MSENNHFTVLRQDQKNFQIKKLKIYPLKNRLG